jgi:tyrosine-protein phosphatase SIW14
MTPHWKLISGLAAPCALVLALGISASAASPAATATATGTGTGAGALSRIHIGNFGKVDDEYYRGAQPDRRDYGDLAALGVKTVVDLTQDGRDDEKGLVEQAGMTFYRIPLTTSERPSDPAVKQFLSIVNDPARQPVYVHCQGGQHRTGVMTAVYRMTRYGWTEDKAYDEMKQYKFETFWGHPELRQFVHDFYSKLTPVASPLVASAALPAVDGHRPEAN